MLGKGVLAEVMATLQVAVEDLAAFTTRLSAIVESVIQRSSDMFCHVYLTCIRVWKYELVASLERASFPSLCGNHGSGSHRAFFVFIDFNFLMKTLGFFLVFCT